MTRDEHMARALELSEEIATMKLELDRFERSIAEKRLEYYHHLFARNDAPQSPTVS